MMLIGPLRDERRQRRQALLLRTGTPLLVSDGALFQRQFDDAMLKPLLGRELALQFFLMGHGGDGTVDAEHLMVPRHHLAGLARLAFIEQDEVLDHVEQPVMRQHAIKQGLGVQLALVGLLLSLPFGEVIPLAGDRAVTGAVAIGDDQKGVVVEGMGDDVLVHIVAQIAVETGADVLVDRLQLDEDQRQSVDEADEIGAAVVVRRAQASQFQFPHGEEAVGTRRIVEIDHADAGIAALAVGVPPGNRHAIADCSREILIVLDQRAAEIMDGERPQRVGDGRRRQVGVEAFQRGAQIAGEHRFGRVLAPQSAARPEGLLVPGIDRFPAENVLQMRGEGRLHQPVLAVDARHCHVIGPFRLASYGDLPAHEPWQKQVAGLGKGPVLLVQFRNQPKVRFCCLVKELQKPLGRKHNRSTFEVIRANRRISSAGCMVDQMTYEIFCCDK